MDNQAEQRAWIQTWASRIGELGLSSVILSLLEAGRPFGLLGSQALLMAQPLLAGIVNDAALEQTITLLDSPELLNQLKTCLETEEVES